MSARAWAIPMTYPCSVNDLLNPILDEFVAVENAARSAWNVVLVSDVCATGCCWIIVDPDDKNSGRCTLKSGTWTLKCALMISFILVPPRASNSSSDWTMNASLRSFIVAAVAVDRSAYSPGSDSENSAASLAPPANPDTKVLSSPKAIVRLWSVPSVCPFTLIGVPSPNTGAVDPSGRSTASPFCGHGKHDVK